ncbi:MAG: hypothetical protein QE267_08590 [Akkermansiaceae bacterium]|nr:hypothetical protein [Akkermansiaceae bacterium]
MKPYLSTILVALAFALVGCATNKVASKQEARYRLAEQKRVGLVSKDQYADELTKISLLPIPEEPTKPYNTGAIQREYEREARGSLIAPLTRDYNSGAINQMVYKKRLLPALYAMMESNQRSTTSARKSSYSQTTYVPGYTGSQFDPKSLANPYGAGNPYKADGLINPYSQYGSRYSNKSWTNPYATNAPKLYDANGKYLGRLSTNKYDPDSVSNPYGRYGNKYSPDSVNNPYGAGNPYNRSPIYIAPQR